MADAANPDLVLRVRTLLTTLRGRHEQYVDAITDAAQIAVNQVQDKRIELQENPPADIDQLFFEMMFELLPFNTLLSAAVRQFTRENYGSLLRTRLAFKLLSSRPVTYGSQSPGPVADRKSALSRAEALTVNELFLRRGAPKEVQQAYGGNVFDFFETVDTKIAAGKAQYDKLSATIVATKAGRAGIPLDPGASPATQILQQTLSFARKFSYTQSALSLQIDNLLSVGAFDDAELDLLAGFLGRQLEKAAHNYEELRAGYVLWIELCIWIEIFTPPHVPGKLTIELLPRRGTLRFKGRTPDNEDTFSTELPVGLAKYLIERIADSPLIEVRGRGLPALQRLADAANRMRTSREGLLADLLR